MPVMDTSALTGTTISIKEEPIRNPAVDVDRKPVLEAGESGGELPDFGNIQSSELNDGNSAAGLLPGDTDMKPDPSYGLGPSTKAPVAKKGKKLSYVGVII